MRKWITFLMTLLVGSGVSYANAGMGQVEFEAGYRHDNISWRHRVPSCDPFIKESTRFHDLDIFQIGLSGRTTLGCNLYLRACGYWGWVLDGDFQESATVYNNDLTNNNSYYSYSDYSSCASYGSSSGSNTDEFSCVREAFTFSNSDRTIIDDKYVYGVSGAVGYPFYFCDCTVIAAPVIGYAVDEQNIRVQNDGVHLTEGRGNNRGLLFPTCGDECCRQTFISRWYGGFVGLDFCYRPFNECWNVYAEVEYHWGDFRGKRNIRGHREGNAFDRHNFRSQEATGWVACVGADYDLSDCWTLGLNVKFQDWSATRHHRRHCDEEEIAFLGSGENRERQNFKWNSYCVNLTIGHHF